MKKSRILIISLLFFLVVLSGCQKSEKQGIQDGNNDSQNNGDKYVFGSDVMVNAKTDSFRNGRQLEKAAPVIVLATKVKEQEPVVSYDKNGLFEIAYTISHVKVEKVIKGDKKMKGELLPIFENEAYDKKTRKTMHIAGYEKMLMNRQYLLLLMPSETDENFIPLGVTYGKIPLKGEESEFMKSLKQSKSEEAKGFLEEFHEVNEVQQEVRKDFQI